MKKWQAFFLISFLAVVPLQAQIYHAGEENSAGTPRRNWVEISAAGTRSFSTLQDGGNNKQISHQDAFSGRALFLVTPNLGLGIEGTWFEEEKSIPFVPSYKVQRYGVVGKWTLTPDTAPKAYLLAGAGKTKRQLRYEFPLSEESKTNYYLAGVGLDVRVWHNFFVAAELAAVYNAHEKIGKFFHLKHRWETEASLRAGVRF